MTFLHAPKNSWEHLELVSLLAPLIFLFLSLPCCFFFFFLSEGKLVCICLRRRDICLGGKVGGFFLRIGFKASLSILLWRKLKSNSTFQLSVLLMGKRKAITNIIVQVLGWILSAWSYKESWIIARNLLWTKMAVLSLIKCLEHFPMH